MKSKMQDITDQMLQFKDAIRHVWNSYFASCDSPASPEVQEAFEHVEKGLFLSIVLIPLGAIDRVDDYREKPLSWLVIRPPGHLRDLPLQLGRREKSGNTIWDTPISVRLSGKDCAAFEFYDFFDWRPFGVIDLPLVRSRVAALPGQPNASGSLALIEQRHCRFLFAG